MATTHVEKTVADPPSTSDAGAMQVDSPAEAKHSDATTNGAQAKPPSSSSKPRQRVRQVSPRTLQDFKNSHELVYVFAGAVRAHERLHKDAGVLHGDINPNTILILDWPAGDSESAATGKTEGALVDFDVPYSVAGVRQLLHPWPYKFA